MRSLEPRATVVHLRIWARALLYKLQTRPKLALHRAYDGHICKGSRKRTKFSNSETEKEVNVPKQMSNLRIKNELTHATNDNVIYLISSQRHAVRLTYIQPHLEYVLCLRKSTCCMQGCVPAPASSFFISYSAFGEQKVLFLFFPSESKSKCQTLHSNWGNTLQGHSFGYSTWVIIQHQKSPRWQYQEKVVGAFTL
jgi:hypothetical protein